MNKTQALTYKDWAAHVTYDLETGHFFRKKSTGSRWRAGDRTGLAINNRGYMVLSLHGRPTLAHRVAWLLMHKKWPKEQIDHINRVRTDNRWANLRAASIPQNNANVLKTKQRALPTGVRLNRNRTNPFMAIISVNNKDKYLGSFPTPELAHKAYVAAKQTYHGRFTPY